MRTILVPAVFFAGGLAFAAGCAHSPPPSVAPASTVPTPAPTPPRPPEPGALIQHVVRPEALDPAADRWLEDQYALFDPRAPRANRLVVYLVGANNKAANGRPMMEELAALGFHVLAPMYPNDYNIGEVCQPARDADEDCHRKARLEAWTGEDLSPHLQAKPANAAEPRIARFLAHLAKTHPEEGWGAFLEGVQPRWAEVIVAGRSHGASTAGLVGKLRRVFRVVMMSGPFDNRAGVPAPWLASPSATPVERLFALTHSAEEQHAGHLAAWRAMGLGALGAPVVVDNTAPPFARSHQLVTALPPPPGKNPHGVTSAGSSSARGPDGHYLLGPTWRYLFTAQ